MEDRSMEPWLEKLAGEVRIFTEEKINEWGGLVNRLGMNDRNRNEWADIFKSEVREFMTDLILDVTNTQETLCIKIETLLKRSEELCKQLGIKMPAHGSSNLGLYNEEKELQNQVTELEEEVKKRLKELQLIKTRQQTVCERLGKLPTKINESPLPTRKEIDDYISHIEQLEKERIAREQKFRSLKSEILQVNAELKLKPSLDFEKMVLDENNDVFAVTDSNMNLLQSFHETVLDQHERVKDEIEGLREKLLGLWEILQQDSQDCNAFLERHPGNSMDTLHALQSEVKRCEELKRANIKVFIQKLRNEIAQLWEKCKFTPEQRNHFEYFNDNLYTEDLLTLHDLEMNRLKTYYNENSEIYELLDRREAFWSKMLELEERATAPDRYKNRGGQLLKEEKERNALSKKIPKIEEKLLQLTTEYEIKHGKKFLYWGEPIDSIIKRSHDNYEEDKKLKLSARKQQRDLTVTPANPYMSMGPSSLVKKTPLLSLNVPRCTPLKVATGSKRALNTPLPSVKRIKQREDLNRKGLRTAPAGTGKVQLRYSKEKKKRIEKLRRLTRSIQQQKQSDESSATSDYNFFKTELSARESCRSTLFKENCASPLVGTPRKIYKVTSEAPVQILAAKNLDILI